MAKFKIYGNKNCLVHIPSFGKRACERVQFDENGILNTDDKYIADYFKHQTGYHVIEENGKN